MWLREDSGAGGRFRQKNVLALLEYTFQNVGGDVGDINSHYQGVGWNGEGIQDLKEVVGIFSDDRDWVLL